MYIRLTLENTAIIFPLWGWILFHIIIIGMLIVDLKVFQKTAHIPSIKESGAWSAVWIGCSLVFALIILFMPSSMNGGQKPFTDFMTAYLIEKSLSIDNLFVFAVIFSYFAVPFKYQRKILFLGILGAIITRGLFIFFGIKLIELFSPLLYVFAIILLYSGYKIIKNKNEETKIENNIIVKLATRFLSFQKEYVGDKLYVKKNKKIIFTPLALVLIAVEATDIVFAVDSVPAVLSITNDFFIAYTSNILAVLGLRALYFLLIGSMVKLKYLNLGLGVILSYLGVKLILHDFIHFPNWISLVIIAIIFIVVIISSFYKKDK